MGLTTLAVGAFVVGTGSAPTVSASGRSAPFPVPTTEAERTQTMAAYDLATGLNLVVVKGTTTLHLAPPDGLLTLCGRIAGPTPLRVTVAKRCRRCQWEAARRAEEAADAD